MAIDWETRWNEWLAAKAVDKSITQQDFCKSKGYSPPQFCRSTKRFRQALTLTKDIGPIAKIAADTARLTVDSIIQEQKNILAQRVLPKAVARIEQVIEGSEDEGVAVRASLGVMDRAGLGPDQKPQVAVIVPQFMDPSLTARAVKMLRGEE